MRNSSPSPFSAATMLGLVVVVLFCQKLSFVQSQSLPLLLVVSFDGFRHDYSTVYGPLKNFRRIEEHGVRTHSMIPTFTTASIPNHYSLVTGVYQEVHGLIAEEMFDRRTNRTFSSWSNNNSEQWWPIEPIWTLNEQRKEARSGVIGWPQNNLRVKKSEAFRQGGSMKEMIDRMLQWFNDPTEPINFGAIHFHEPATTGFRSGPFSSSMSKTIQLCDEHLGYLLDEIDKNTKLRNNLHLIVTSSQGMEQVNRTDFPIYLDDFVDMRKVNVFGSSTLMNIFLKSNSDQMDVLRNLSRIPIGRSYRPEDLPVRYHYKHSSRLGDFILLAQPGYEILRRKSNDGRWNTTHGNVGYDNELEAMKTIFYASGPQFKENFSLPSSQPLHLVDLFPLMCSLLNLHPCRPSNGSLKNIQPFLIDPFRTLNLTEKESEKLHDGPMGLVIYLLVLVSFVLILIMAVVWSAVSFRHGTTFLRTAQNDPNTFDEQNQYKFTQINDRKLNSAIGNDNL